MNIKVFLLAFISVYLLISLPAILGIGYVIDWITEATLFQKVKGYLVNGLVDNFPVKMSIAFIVGTVVSVVITKRGRN